MTEWPKSRLLAAQYQSPFYSGIGFARYASSGTVTPDLWKNIERIESDAAANPGAPEVEHWAEDMVALRAALKEEGVVELHMFSYTLTIFAEDSKQADRVAIERVGYEEDLSEYGVGEYRLDVRPDDGRDLEPLEICPVCKTEGSDDPSLCGVCNPGGLK